MSRPLKGGANYQDLKSIIEGGVSTSLNSPVKVIDKFGNTTVSLGSTRQDIWSVGGTYPTFAVGTCTVASNSVQDSEVGTGASCIFVEYLTEDDELVEEFVFLNGEVSVALSKPLSAINRSYVVRAGTNNRNVGTITFTCDGVTVGQIAANVGQTQQAIYTVPKGYSAHFVEGHVSVNSSATARVDVALYVVNNSIQKDLLLTKFVTYASSVDRYFDEFPAYAKTFSHGDKILLSVINSSSNNVKVDGQFIIKLYRNDNIASGVVFAANVGSQETFVNTYASESKDVTWEYDGKYGNTEGVTGTIDKNILDISDNTLFNEFGRENEIKNVCSTYREYNGNFNFIFPTSCKNNIRINFYFVEPTYTSAGQRVFSISVNDSTPASLTNIDLFSLIGAVNKVKKVSYEFTANSYTKIKFLKVTDNPIISGIEIEKI